MKGEVEEACRATMVHEFIKDFPDGYEMHLGQAGYGLSSGQRQRLTLACARLWNPSLLILGKPFSLLCFAILTPQLSMKQRPH